MAFKGINLSNAPQLILDAIGSIGGTNLIILLPKVLNSVTAGNYQTLYRAGVAPYAAYQVTAGKTLYIIGALIQTGTAGNKFTTTGYGDTAVDNSAAAPTNSQTLLDNLSLSATNLLTAVPLILAIPATKYPYIQQNATGHTIAIFWGFEE